MTRWKKIRGFPDYEVSDEGNVRSLKYGRIKRLKPRSTRSGYLRVSLSAGSKIVDAYIHRLVAQLFLCNPKARLEINHKNGLKFDNKLSNLEWSTRTENMQHAACSGLQRSPSKPIVCVELNKKFPSIKAAARALCLHRTGIRKVLDNSYATTGGYTFRRVS